MSLLDQKRKVVSSRLVGITVAEEAVSMSCSPGAILNLAKENIGLPLNERLGIPGYQYILTNNRSSI